jgi:hypothetical protein
MNLQEQIRKILREELGLPSYLRRRTTKDELDDIFREATQYVLQPNKSFKKEGTLFIGGNLLLKDSVIENNGLISVGGEVILIGNSSIDGTGTII